MISFISRLGQHFNARPAIYYSTPITVTIVIFSPFFYSGRGPQGEAVIQLSYAWLGCAAKWGQMSKLPRAVFEAEIEKAVRKVFPEIVVPDPLDMVFKYWEKGAWYVRCYRSNLRSSCLTADEMGSNSPNV